MRRRLECGAGVVSMISYFLCVQLLVIAAVSGGSFMSCVHVYPLSEFLVRYSNFTAYCILNHTCLQKNGFTVSTDKLYWDINGQKIPESQYTIINETTASVTFQPTLTTANTLSCSFDASGQVKTNLHGLIFNVGYPPQKPSNLSCTCYNDDRQVCSWNTGRDTLIPTNYTVMRTRKGMAEDYNIFTNLPAARGRGRSSTLSKYEYSKTQRSPSSWADSRAEHCVTKTNSCTVSYCDLHVYTTFWVEASNELGKVSSDKITLDMFNTLKPNPPEIVRVVSAVELQRALKIEWKNPMSIHFSMKYNITYRRSDRPEWFEVPEEDTNSHRTSYTLQDLEPYTTYVLTMRCKLMTDQGYWSDWSRNYTATTPESAPSQGPEFWRKISEVGSDGNRAIWLMWKDLESFANGRILGYNITIKTGATIIDRFSIKDRNCNITMSKDSFQVALIAYNSFGPSPPSTLRIPEAKIRGALLPDISVKAFPKDGKLWVEWTAPQKSIYGYVIEWCENMVFPACSTGWQREPSTAKGAFLRGDVKPLVYYWIKVYPLYTDGLDRPRSVGAYLKQGVPEEGPTVKYKTLEKTRAELVWEPVPLGKQQGFITSYTLKYFAKNGPIKTAMVNATEREYTLTDLNGGTLYEVRVTANTEIGGTEGNPFTFSTNKFGVGEVEAIVVCSCLGFFICLLVGVILFCNKRELIKKHIWPNVPDPSKSNIAHWSPHTPTRHDPKRHPFKDDSFTDVSVVEITAEKKSYSEQDLKSVDTIKKNTSECLSSGIGGSSCLSSPRLSMSDTDEVESAQNTSSTVQYSTVIISGYRGQQPTAAVQPTFSRSESTQPLLDSEDRPDEQPVLEIPNQYFKQNCAEEDSAGRLPASQQENLSTCLQEPAGQSQSISSCSPEMDLQDFSGNPTPSDLDSGCSEIKSYLPQTARQGGYMPQ